MNGKTLLITGGAGYIGSHAVVEFQQKGCKVVVADSLFNSGAEVLERIATITGIRPEFEQADLSVAENCKRVFDRHPDIEAVVNFAAHKVVGESMEKPVQYYANNVGIVLNLLSEMEKRGIRHFIQSSSCTVYGEPGQLPIRESSPTQFATSPYGNTKQIAEDMLYFSAQSGKIQSVALRYFNPIGAHETALIGELPMGVPNNLMPFITQTAIGKRKQLTVFGNDYPTPDGTCIRDYIHVMDLARAHVVALDRCFAGKNKKTHEVFNIGTGYGCSVMQVIDSFERSTGQKLNYIVGPRRNGDIIQIWADTTFAEKELGWKARYGLDDMTLSAWRWELKWQELRQKKQK